ncbi:hypothetical protein C1631_014070 [Chryseobacterium phosphatilyticum]|uniref:Type IV secretion protein Rhs n=1 Tax=Chryseobacterium phosphatilyticum TaxID=475075 RepID=A0A316X6M9_9FLAO|nr:RHS repeat-associated core domain-containing protein [Chryseobacterium phosphatilyticum]PWN69184.1 hypothetical protein C1631_014070 [Chryseobacterium phosphatilyticum]
MKVISSLILSLCSVLSFSQTIPDQKGKATGTVRSSQSASPGKVTSLKTSEVHHFSGKQAPKGILTDSNAGADNPSGTTAPDGQSYHDTKGKIEVTGTGQLQFTLPISLPPGVKNIAPQVNLIYTNGAGNGIAGYGWNLSGITSISRTGRNIEKDGAVKGIKLDYTDYYSFNGQRLILKSGEYGKDGAEYVTEKFSNIKIKSIGAITGQPWQGPEYWEVTFEDGSQAWYGSATSARTPMEYNIVKWKDPHGNYIVYNYSQGSANNVAVLANVEWGGNETIGKAHFNKIEFNYGTRDIKESSYVNGVHFLQDKLLNNLIIYTDGKLFKSYEITYKKSGSNYQFVDRIKEKNSAGESANPVIFSYENTAIASNKEYKAERFDDLYENKNDIIGADFNGDQKIDFVYKDILVSDRYNNQVKYPLANILGRKSSAGKAIHNGELLGYSVLNTLEIVGDFSPQNYAVKFRQYDLSNQTANLIKDKSMPLVQISQILEMGDPEVEIYWGQPFAAITKDVHDTDFIGDGTSQMLFKYSLSQKSPYLPGNRYVEVLNSYFYYNPETNQWKSLYKKILRHSTVKVGDFDGDGKSEIFEYRTDGSYHIWKFENDQFSVVQSGNNVKLTDSTIIGDFNGDKKIDFLTPDGSESTGWNLYVSNGKGFQGHYYPDLILFEPWRVGAPRKKRQTSKSYLGLDTNNDGKTDILVFESQLWSRDGVFDWNNPDSSFGISRLISDGSNPDGRINFRYVTDYTPVELNQNIETLNFSMYGEHYLPILGNNILQNKIYITHKTKLISINFEDVTKASLINKVSQDGIDTNIVYNQLDEALQQSSASQYLYPYFRLKVNPNYYLVSKLIQGNRKMDYKYRDFVIHLKGKGMSGFKQSARSSWYTDNLVNTKIWSGVETDPFNDAVPVKEWSIKTNAENAIFPADISENNNQLLSFKSSLYSFDKLLNGALVDINTVSSADKPKIISATIPVQTVTKDFLKDIRTQIDIVYNKTYYLPGKTTTNINNGFSVSTSELNYFNNESGIGKDYYVGRPKLQIERAKVYNDEKISLTEFTYQNNLLKSSGTILGNNFDDNFLQEYIYDGFGNAIEKKVTTSIDMKSKTEKTLYDPKGRFIVKKTDHLGLETTIEYNDEGQVTKHTNPLGVVLTKEYDAWGKLLKFKNNLTGVSTYTYEKIANTGHLKITEYQPTGDVGITFINNWGQSYLSTTKKVDQGEYVSIKTMFDELGRKTGESEPHSGGPFPMRWNTMELDDYSRTIKTISFTGKVVEIAYNQRTVTTTELGTGNGASGGNNRFKKQIKDPLENVISSEDQGGVITYKYNAAGNNTEANYQGNIVKTAYDIYGNKTRFEDPSNGVYEYEYYGFMGAVSKIKSPKGEKTFEYNTKGQLIKQTEKTASGNDTDKSITFTYNDKGLITQKTGTSKGNPYSSNIVYDPQGRIVSSSESSNGRNFASLNTIYDDKGRVTSYEKQLQSAGITTKITIENVYSPWNGELYQIKDKNSGKVLWELESTTDKGQIVKAKLGATTITNGYDYNNFLASINHSSAAKPSILQVSYTFDAIKNELKNRTTGGDFNIVEQFDYEDHNRLVNWTNPVTGIKPSATRNIYDVKGRITQNDQVGTIKFQNTAKMYQPTGMTLNGEGTQNYNNDLIQTITYNENNDPVFIDGEKGDAAFQYGLTAMRQRVTYGGNFGSDAEGKFTKFYSEDGNFEVLKDNTTGKEKHILYVEGSPYESDIIFLKDYNENTGSYKFLHKDYIGSILAISDEAGNKLEQRHFDAWGNFTHLQIGNGAIITDKQQLLAANLLIDRGYTGHEHFTEIGIIHMNGRLYDPLLRRFLNADENIQDPYNTQNYNKYGYVLNNPLMYNDPSGEIVWWVAAGIFAVVSHAAQSYIMNQPMTLQGLAHSLIMSYTSSVISMGIDQVFQVASTALNFGSLGAKAMSVLANGVSGSISSLMGGGGNLGNAFITSIITSSLSKGIEFLAASGGSSSSGAGAGVNTGISGSTGSSTASQGASESYTIDNTITVTLPEVILKNKATWQRDLANHITSSVANYWADYNLQQSRIRLGNAIANSRIAQEIGAFEKFLFLDLPLSFAGGELAVIGWRTLGVGRFLTGSLSKLTTTEGFLGGSIGVKLPFNLRVGLYASDKTITYGSFRYSTLAPRALTRYQWFGRNMLQITTDFQPTLGTWSSQIIPKGTTLRIGLIGQQPGNGFGTWLQLYATDSIKFIP